MSEGQGRVKGLAPPAVAPEVYTEDYYLHWCGGHEDWVSSGGSRPDALYQGSLTKARFASGDVLVDLGTGRGELLVVAVEKGAQLALGIEYSLSALELAKRTLSASSAGPRAVVTGADSRRLPLPDSMADLVTMLDIVEHLTPQELHDTLVEARRILRPGGRLFAHTMPTRTVYGVTYRIQRLTVPGRRRRWPADPRVEPERVMHVNEQTRTSLHRALKRAGFASVSVTRGDWVHDRFVPDEQARRLYHRLARRKVTAWLAIADLWAEATRPG
jgi:ubiquinone/menaquinone biosynthesis C-methylase UbiE